MTDGFLARRSLVSGNTVRDVNHPPRIERDRLRDALLRIRFRSMDATTGNPAKALREIDEIVRAALKEQS